MILKSKIACISAAMLVTAISVSATGQTRFRVAAQAEGGLYVFNSENNLPLLENGKLICGYGANTSVSCSLAGENVLAVDLQYFRSDANSPLVFYYSDGSPGTVMDYYGKVAVDEFSSDIGLRHLFTNWLQLGLGPSFGMISRTTEVPFAEIADRLNSFCLGAHAVAGVSIPFDKSSNGGFFWYYTLKLRYLHSVFFDARGRDLAGYSQSFLTASLAAGVGYAF